MRSQNPFPEIRSYPSLAAEGVFWKALSESCGRREPGERAKMGDVLALVKKPWEESDVWKLELSDS